MAKSVLVTGSSRGIGRATARNLAEGGYDIVLHFHQRIDAVMEVKREIEELGSSVRVLQFDIGDRQQCREVLEADIEENGIYFGVVCNAGVVRDNAFPAITEDEWDSVLHTNLDGFYNVLRPLVMPMVRAREGRIVTLASVSGIIGQRGQVNYSASKAGIIGATKALAVELAKRKITVNCVAPGLIETEMIEDAPIAEALTMIPLRRVGTPEEVASLIRYLLSDGAAYITRQVISVNGGMC
ncbi:MAG: 3-ketoacyl-ACP reductase FabG2 [Pseudomonadales bacterium]|nr:3-ketoacyl-ACP reductase FabG2 [Pseudomonadales bacterium]MDP7596939.1 3-ketoacyl-ACP reductase FabG2 [Pseudomonadales bacterium]HJN50396.1 3-ketoacyl-ACP reductase FabG2 [Pseudomonadales bacterium]